MRQKGRSRQVLALSKVAAAGPQENPAGPGAPVLGGPFQLLLVTMGELSVAPSSGAEARGAKTRGQIGKILLLGWTRSTNKSMIKRLKRKIREGRLLVVPAQSRV